jgi:hypothetical protein
MAIWRLSMFTNLVAHREPMLFAHSMRKTRTTVSHRPVNPCHAWIDSPAGCAVAGDETEREEGQEPELEAGLEAGLSGPRAPCVASLSLINATLIKKNRDPGSLRTVEYIEKIKACYTRLSTTSVLCSVVAPQSSSGHRMKM